MNRSKRAFTLVELLVVIGIIAILISMLLPSLNTMRQRAVRLTCMSNLRQVGAAIQMYAKDYNEYPLSATPDECNDPSSGWFNSYGQGHRWKTLLIEHRLITNAVASCTAQTRDGHRFEQWHAGDDGLDGHYYYGGPLSGGGVVWDIAQQWYPSGSGYQPQANSLIRDTNVKVRTKGLRTLAICPTLFTYPWESGQWRTLEPHGRQEPTSLWSNSAPYSYPIIWTNAYDRNCLFNDGHVENRIRKGTLSTSSGTGWIEITCPWMDGPYSGTNPMFRSW